MQSPPFCAVFYESPQSVSRYETFAVDQDTQLLRSFEVVNFDICVLLV